MSGITVESIPALGCGKIRPEYREPDYGAFPFHYSIEDLAQAAVDAEFALRAVQSWNDHYSKLAYFLQFKDDVDAGKFKEFHSHTELATAILNGRLGIDCGPLWETYEWLIRFKFVQEGYRADSEREQNYDKHVEELERVERQFSDRYKSGRITQRAVEMIRVHVSGWAGMPGIKLSKPHAKSGGVALFYSNSHVDESLRDQLERHLSALQRQGLICQWHDRRIGAGEEWRGQIDQHLTEADIVLLLISPDFISSDYCYDVEMEQALARHRSGDARVIPVFLRSCDWEGCPFGELQGLPKDAKPITTWTDRDVAFTDVSKGLRKIVVEMIETRNGATPR